MSKFAEGDIIQIKNIIILPDMDEDTKKLEKHIGKIGKILWITPLCKNSKWEREMLGDTMYGVQITNSIGDLTSPCSSTEESKEEVFYQKELALVKSFKDTKMLLTED